MIENGSASTIWMNVTTSANWNRPPVGIVRVEQALCAELKKLFGNDRFRQCVWVDDSFVEWSPPELHGDDLINGAIDSIFPKSVSFDLARVLVSSAIKRFRSFESQENTVNVSIPVGKRFSISPKPGDVLISVGLDWGQPYAASFYKLSKEGGVKVITCCYDLIPVLFPQYCVGEVAQMFKEYFTQISWGSTALLCISKQTQSDYLALSKELGFPERRTKVIPLGDNVPADIGAISDTVASLTEEPFILFVSTIERRKNHEVLYRAYHILSKRGKVDLPKLVFVGMPGWGVGDLLKDIELDPLTQGLIVQLNHVNDGELNLLYKTALFCVYPSLYEGWGLPVGEALAFGNAVIASDRGSLPEVGEELVRYVDPWNPQAWADAIIEFVENPSLVSSIRDVVKSKYNKRLWSQTAVVVKELIDEILSESASIFSFYPGYDMSTAVGVHVGEGIASTGKGGYLMYGPHRHLAAGVYKISIFGQVNNDESGLVSFDFVSHGATKEYFQDGFVISKHGVKNDLLVTFDVTLLQDVDDFEIRCIVPDDLALVLNCVSIDCLMGSTKSF